ncbi:hypothetical protein DY955_02485 [Pseudomonas aeruginosa]|nr:hypothetical protein DY955_02485 [Pseudomonas aeruginosa]
MAVQCSVRGCCWRPRKQGNASSVFRGAELVDGMAQLRPELTEVTSRSDEPRK